MTPDRQPLRHGFTTFGPLALLFVASGIFLWMFAAADGLDRSVADGAIEGGPAISARAHQFGLDWKHGLILMPVYVPGFLLLAPCFLVLARSRSATRPLVQGVLVILLAGVVALAFSPIGTRYLLGELAASEDVTWNGEAESPMAMNLLPGIATIAAFGALIVSAHHAIRRRQLRILLLPAAGYVTLAAIRGGGVDFGELATEWVARGREGDVTAWFSFAILVAIATAGALDAWRLGGRHKPRQSGTMPARPESLAS